MHEKMQGSTKYLIPSTLGIGLVEGYDAIGFEQSLSKSELRREVSNLASYVHLSFSPSTVSHRLSGGWLKSVKAKRARTRFLGEHRALQGDVHEDEDRVSEAVAGLSTLFLFEYTL